MSTQQIHILLMVKVGEKILPLVSKKTNVNIEQKCQTPSNDREYFTAYGEREDSESVADCIARLLRDQLQLLPSHLAPDDVATHKLRLHYTLLGEDTYDDVPRSFYGILAPSSCLDHIRIGPNKSVHFNDDAGGLGFLDFDIDTGNTHMDQSLVHSVYNARKIFTHVPA